MTEKKKKKEALGWMEWLRGWFYVVYEMLFQRIMASHLQNPMPLPPINDLTCIVTGSTSGIGREIARSFCFLFFFGQSLIDWLFFWFGAQILDLKGNELVLIGIGNWLNLERMWLWRWGIRRRLMSWSRNGRASGLEWAFLLILRFLYYEFISAKKKKKELRSNLGLFFQIFRCQNLSRINVKWSWIMDIFARFYNVYCFLFYFIFFKWTNLKI